MIKMVSSSVIEAIGKTPMVSLSRMTKGLEGQISSPSWSI